MKSLLKSFTKKIVYLLGILIVVSAFFVTVVHYITPLLDKHRINIETIASEYLNTPVKIKRLRVSWYQYQPVIRLDQLTLLDKTTHKPILRVKQINMLISIPQSLWQRKIVSTGLLASGASLSVSKSPKGEWVVQELSSLGFNQGATNPEAAFKEVMGWLSNEQRLILRNIDLHFQGLQQDSTFVTLYDLSFSNSSNDHEINGKAILHQSLPTEVTINANWQGNSFDLQQIKAKLYVYVSGLSLSQWAKGFSYQSWQVQEGIASAKIWATWDKGSFQTLQSTVQFYGLHLLSDKKTQTPFVLNRLSGNIGWKRAGEDQIIAGDEILIDLPGHLWPATGFYIDFSHRQDGEFIPKKASVGYVDLADLQAFLKQAKISVPTSINQLLSTATLSGGIQHATLVFAENWQDWQHLNVSASFDRVGVSAYHSLPGMQNLTGELQWLGDQGHLKINSSHVTCQYPSVFQEALALDQLTGSIDLSRESLDQWTLQLKEIKVLNNDLAVNLQGNVIFPKAESPNVNLAAHFDVPRADNLRQYLPMKFFESQLVDWLNQAFVQGEVKEGNAILRGRLADFPFDKGEGEFNINAKVDHFDFRFAPDWPLLEKMSAEVVFSGRKLLINVAQAETLGIMLPKITGTIANVSGDRQPATLQVSTDTIQTDLQQGLQYVYQSPLKKTLGEMFKNFKLAGPIQLTLGLTVPLSHPDESTVKGQLKMTEATMDLQPWHLRLNKMSGQLDFTEKNVAGTGFKALLFDKPFQFNLATKQVDTSHSIIQASFENALSLDDLQSWLNLPYQSVVSGKPTVAGTIDFSLTQPVAIALHSNLVGANIRLADQFAKASQEARAFNAQMIVAANQPMKVKVQYGSILNAAALLNREEDTFKLLGVELRFGNGMPDWPKRPGLFISGQFDRLDWNMIQSYLGKQNNSSFVSSLPLKGIDIRANNVALEGLSLSTVHLQALPNQKMWQVLLGSNEINGNLQIPMPLTKGSTVTANLDMIKLNVATTGITKSSTILNLKTMPNIVVNAKEVTINQMKLGQITLKADSIKNGLSIQKLHIQSPHLDLRATGEWQQANTGMMTHLQGGATSARVSELLSSLGLGVRNLEVSNGSLNFILDWSGAPYYPAMATMNGRASLVLGHGRIVDVGKENGTKMDMGRMLSIFSLQTIPRRLSLDFSDVFQKGYSFDSVRGDFVIKQGDLNTSNLRFEGPVAKIGIDGRIGLKRQDYDFLLSVSANVTSSIPVAATLLTGNPLVGIGAFAVNAMIGSEVSKVTTNYYRVTGPWNNPVWKSASGKKN